MPTLVIIACLLTLSIVYSLQYFGDLEPCKLCVYQRWPWWSALLLAILTYSPGMSRRWILILTTLCGISILIGGAIALYHFGIELDWWNGLSTCTQNEALPQTLAELHNSTQLNLFKRCDEVPWSLFGLSMAGYNMFLSAALSAIVLSSVCRRMK